MPGRIEYIAGFEGEWFKSGTELVRIDDDDLLAQQRSAFANLEAARLAERNAGVQYSRELWSPQSRNINRMPGFGLPAMFDNVFTQNFSGFAGDYDPDVQRYSDLYAQGTQLNQSRSQVAQAQSRLDELSAKLRDTRSVAPFDGVVARKLIEVGAVGIHHHQFLARPGGILHKSGRDRVIHRGLGTDDDDDLTLSDIGHLVGNGTGTYTLKQGGH